MPQIRNVYRAQKKRSAINKAIRAEIPGGAEILDALAIAAPLREKGYAWWRVYKLLDAAREAAEKTILEKTENQEDEANERK